MARSLLGQLMFSDFPRSTITWCSGETRMARIVEGLLQHVDQERGQVVIGGETFELLQGGFPGRPISPQAPR